jgi:hypothetical protein
MKKMYKRNIIVILLCVVGFMTSCNKENVSPAGGGSAKVIVSLKGIERMLPTSVGPMAKQASVGGMSTTSAVQSQENIVYQEEIALSGFEASVTLVADAPVQSSTKASLQKLASVQKVASYNGTSTPGNVELVEDDVHYRLLAYQGGVLKDQMDYIVGQEDDVEFMLDAGTYTFVAYSLNKDIALPATDGVSPLSGVADEDLLYFKQEDVVIQDDQTTYLEVLFKHKFSKITTVITKGPYVSGDITFADGFFWPHYGNATVSLSDGAVTYGVTATPYGKPVYFAGNQSSITFTEIVSNAGYDNSVTTSLNFRELTIGSITKRIGMRIGDIQLNPGTNYTLNINLNSFSEDLGHTFGNLVWAPGYLVDNGSGVSPRYTFSDDYNGFYNAKTLKAPSTSSYLRERTFPWNFLISRKYITYNGQDGTATTWSSANDPCTKVGDGKWRTPTHAEVGALRDGYMNYVNNSPAGAKYMGSSRTFGNYRYPTSGIMMGVSNWDEAVACDGCYLYFQDVALYNTNAPAAHLTQTSVSVSKFWAYSGAFIYTGWYYRTEWDKRGRNMTPTASGVDAQYYLLKCVRNK